MTKMTTDRRPMIRVNIDQEVGDRLALVDTGSQVNAISLIQLPLSLRKKIKRTNKVIRSFEGKI